MIVLLVSKSTPIGGKEERVNFNMHKFVDKLPPSAVDGLRGLKEPFDVLGKVVYKRTYARTLDTGQREEWWQTVVRCVNGIAKYGAFTEENLQDLAYNVHQLRCSFSGRYNQDTRLRYQKEYTDRPQWFQHSRRRKILL